MTDVERLYVTRRVELIGSFRRTERGPGETPAPTRTRIWRGMAEMPDLLSDLAFESIYGEADQ